LTHPSGGSPSPGPIRPQAEESFDGLPGCSSVDNNWPEVAAKPGDREKRKAGVGLSYPRVVLESVAVAKGK
jgi:hypothetical protein